MIVKIYLNETTIPVIFSGSSVNIEYGNNEVDFKDGKIKIKTNKSNDINAADGNNTWPDVPCPRCRGKIVLCPVA